MSVKTKDKAKAQSQFVNVDFEPEFNFDMPYYEASKYFSRLGIVDAKTFYKDLNKYAGRAFTISYINNVNTLKKVKEEIAKQLGDGKISPDRLKEVIQSFAEKNGDNPLKPTHLQTVVTTNMQTAFSQGRQEQLIKSSEPYWMYFNSDPQTDICKELNGNVFKKSDPIWDSYYPPNHFNCHSTVVALDEKGRQDLKKPLRKDGGRFLRYLKDRDPSKQLDPAEGFNVSASKILDTWIKDKCKLLNVENIQDKVPLFKSTKEANEYLSTVLDIPVNLTGINKAYINEFAQTIVDIFADNEQKWMGIKSITRSKSGTIFQNRASFFRDGSTKNYLEVNKSYFKRFKNLTELNARLKENNESKWFSGDCLQDLINHEYAHCRTFSNLEKYRQVEAVWNVKALELPFVSRYGETDMAEYLAEAYVLYKKGKKLDKKTLDLLKKFVL